MTAAALDPAAAPTPSSDRGPSALSFRTLSYNALDGWAAEDHGAAFDVFRTTAADISGGEWHEACVATGHVRDCRAFFEDWFAPVLIEDGADPLFTGYYEPELAASRIRTDRFRHPIYAVPPEVADLPKGAVWFSRAQIEDGAPLDGRGLEIAWLDNPVDAFFLQVQGSGRLSLTDGETIRVGFAGRNGHPYRSIGLEMIRRGLVDPSECTAGAISAWLRHNPGEGRDILRHNPSYVFFRELPGLAAQDGPVGAMNRSVTPLRTVAVDPDVVPLGAPVWIETREGGTRPDRLHRLMVAQDTGAAIRGAQRADIFFGTGAAAGDRAGALRSGGRMVVLLPRAHAAQLCRVA